MEQREDEAGRDGRAKLLGTIDCSGQHRGEHETEDHIKGCFLCEETLVCDPNDAKSSKEHKDGTKRDLKDCEVLRFGADAKC